MPKRQTSKTLLNVFLHFAVCLLAARQLSATTFDKELIGTWESTSNPSHLVGFEANRIVEGQSGLLSVYRLLSKTSTAVTLQRRGRVVHWRIELLGKELTIDCDGKEERYLLSPARAAEIMILPLVAGTLRVPSDVEKRQIQEEINSRYLSEQDIFKQAVLDTSKRSEADNARQRNRTYLRTIYQRFGWLDSNSIGVDASARFVLLAEHTKDLSLLSTILPLAASDLIEHDNAQIYAVAMDSLKLDMGEPQLFATQVSRDALGFCILPVEDSLSAADARLRTLSLPSVQEYFDALVNEYSPGQKFQPRSCRPNYPTLASMPR